jgi:ABC-type glutathione transport system ATPase component
VSSNYAVELENVTAGYMVARGFRSILKQFVVVLRGVNLRVSYGERVAIIGESGSGKTTLLRVILGLLRPKTGKVIVLGKDIYGVKGRARAEVLKRIGYVPQDPYRSLNPVLKVKDIIKEPLEAYGYSGELIEDRIREVVRLVGLPLNVLDETPEELSGGMRQRVLIARALVAYPKMLLLDEPTSALDVSVQAQIISLLNSIYESFNITMITVTHDLAVAQYLADRVVILKDGQVVEEGEFESILKEPKSEYTRSLVMSYQLLSNMSRSESEESRL